MKKYGFVLPAPLFEIDTSFFWTDPGINGSGSGSSSLQKGPDLWKAPPDPDLQNWLPALISYFHNEDI
jgi:hypothetical protein